MKVRKRFYFVIPLEFTVQIIIILNINMHEKLNSLSNKYSKLIYFGFICIPLISLFIFLPNTGVTKDIKTIYHIKIEGEINLGLVPFIERVIKEGESEGIEAIIFEINTFGGRLDAAVDIRDTIIKAKPLTVAYINERAISAGALISLACKKIVMPDGATIGAATPVTINHTKQEIKAANEKVISYFRKEMKATAEKNGRPTLIAEAMVDPDIEIEGLIDKDKLLTLTTSEAIEHKLADFTLSDGLNSIVTLFQLEPGNIVDKAPNWAEVFLLFLSGSIISSLLLIIGFLALIIEFRTPTWGIAGTIGVVCLALFFWGHWVLNLVGWEEILLLMVGLILLALEIFVIPGFGIAGISGIVALSLGIILSLVGRHPSLPEIINALSHFSLVFICVCFFLLIFGRSLLKSKGIDSFVLHAQHKKDKKGLLMNMASNSLPQGEIVQGESIIDESLIGQAGVAYTNLRPAGKGIFGNIRLNVITEGDFLEKGARIRIIQAEGSKIIVKKIKEENED